MGPPVDGHQAERRAGDRGLLRPQPALASPGGAYHLLRPGAATDQEAETLIAAGTDAGLMQLLHLPAVEVEEEQVTPGRQGGPAVAVIGAVLAVIGVFLGLARPDATLAWTGVALTGLGTVEIVVGMVLLPLGRLDGQPPVREAPETAC